MTNPSKNNSYFLEFYIEYPNTKAGMTVWNKQYSLNAYYAGKHWSIRKKDADFWHMLVLEALHKCKQKQDVTMATEPVSITCLFHDSLDCSNHAAMVKMIEDALKGIVIKDDSPKYVRSITMGFHEKPCIQVVVQTAQNF
jgi:hypothetical protein